jgi:3',5'-cyclic-AMP phosphodiesterase
MFSVDEPTLVHEIAYRSSGSSAPRDLTLQIHTVRYRSQFKDAPTFLATADLQGREIGVQNRLLGELLAEEIAILQELQELPAFDLCVLCGDFYDYPDLRKLGGTGDVTSVLNALSQTAAQTFAVLGNHDEVNAPGLKSNITVLDGDVVNTGTFTIGGVSGIIGSSSRNNRKTELDFLAAVDQCSTSRTNLLLLHQGPKGTTDAARGLDLINSRLQRRSNLLVLFGHCHWPFPFQTEGRNLFCNVDARVLAFIPDSEP